MGTEEIVTWLMAHPWCALSTWYVAMSVMTFMLYWRDKRAAVAGGGRTPERVLHLFELLGGWPGARVGQRCLHHKCSKVSYQVEFWIVVALNLLVLAYLCYGWMSGDWMLAVPRSWYG